MNNSIQHNKYEQMAPENVVWASCRHTNKNKQELSDGEVKYEYFGGAFNVWILEQNCEQHDAVAD